MFISLSEDDDSDAKTRWFILAEIFFLAIMHYFLWRDAIHFWDEDFGEADERMISLFDMYRSKKIDIRKYAEYVHEDSKVSSMCVICLEEFGEKDEVAQLPCGHVFHPLCSHLWIREHWNCPLRCKLGLPGETAEGAAQVSRTPPVEETRPQASVTHDQDLEVGLAVAEESVQPQEATHSQTRESGAAWRRLLPRHNASTDVTPLDENTQVELVAAAASSDEVVLASGEEELDLEAGVEVDAILPGQIALVVEDVETAEIAGPRVEQVASTTDGDGQDTEAHV